MFAGGFDELYGVTDHMVPLSYSVKDKCPLLSNHIVNCEFVGIGQTFHHGGYRQHGYTSFTGEMARLGWQHHHCVWSLPNCG